MVARVVRDFVLPTKFRENGYEKGGNFTIKGAVKMLGENTMGGQDRRGTAQNAGGVSGKSKARLLWGRGGGIRPHNGGALVGKREIGRKIQTPKLFATAIRKGKRRNGTGRVVQTRSASIGGARKKKRRR